MKYKALPIPEEIVDHKCQGCVFNEGICAQREKCSELPDCCLGYENPIIYVIDEEAKYLPLQD